jgi:cellulose synthase/poly-beta-1,6-N-acetylglucosamine synthase-like glycosyltransferase
MSLDTLALLALVLAAIPAGLFLVNLFVYRRLPRLIDDLRLTIDDRAAHSRVNCESHIANPVSVLIPARNEEQNIRATLEAVLANRDATFEVIVLDDHSTDHTAAIVSELAARDARVRLESAPPLPAGWCGKQHACHVLAGLARHPLLVFIDADVRLAPDALARMAGFMGGGIDDLKARQTVNHQSSIINRPALASGVPYQELGTFSERLLLPLIHFVLLGYLPMPLMRWTKLAGFSAGCGQLFIARRDAYFAAGGHAAIRATLHDGVKLPRLFRRAGLQTDLFDATDLATCRMYHSNAETWRGLGKNATEGLAAPGTILPMTALLLGGQVLPLVLLAFAPALSSAALMFAGTAAVLAYFPRLVGAWRFRQSIGSALLHPLGVLALLVIQWHALFRQVAGKPAEWKGRRYGAAPVAHAVKAA